MHKNPKQLIAYGIKQPKTLPFNKGQASSSGIQLITFKKEA